MERWRPDYEWTTSAPSLTHFLSSCRLQRHSAVSLSSPGKDHVVNVV